ncbi:N-6 DNA methylase [Luteolibacter sp. Populi]|uniref:class I SAM-dependent DNA methyltransferase n=1 Tax=Luteolibacter sp. Populi TaxID=3230487 RepID=UPI00346565CE
MLSPQLRRKVHDLWSLFWSSGLSNPLVAIEQITFLLFIRQLESLDRERVKQKKRSIYAPTEVKKAGIFVVTKDEGFERCRWSYIKQNVSFPLLNNIVFPWLRSLEQRVGPAQNGNTTLGRISGRLSDAYFILDPNKTDTLKRAIGLIDELFRQLDTRSVNSDIMGDIFEYLLEEVKESGKNGQFRTPRHVIRFMVQLLKPQLGKKILDPACGSGGFLLNTLLQWKADHTDDEVLRLEWDGSPHDVRPVWPLGWKPDFNNSLHGYDNDRTMVRIAWMNLILHDLESPEVHQLDALSKRLEDGESGTYDYILANPPFTGSVDEGDLSENRERFPRSGKASAPITTKSELLFVWLMLDLLKIGGRAAVIVPDGVLFGGTNAHRALRHQLLFENTLEAVVSLPANMFQPYSGVKTSILLFQKAGAKVAKGDEPRTREVWFYEISDEAFSLDQKRKALYGRDNDLWDALVKAHAWQTYRDGDAKAKDVSVATDYHQPDYWEERWRSVDDEFLQMFPDKAGEKGHTWALHELWPKDFPFDPADPRKAGQYDDAVLARVRPVFEKTFRKLVEQIVAHSYACSRQPDEAKALGAAEKKVKALHNALMKAAREESLLDREFDQFGLNALKTVLKEATAKTGEWAAGIKVPDKKPKKASPEPDPYTLLSNLAPLLKDFAKLDGYNVWRRGGKSLSRPGKLSASEDGESRQPNLLSWIVPVRRWAERTSWSEEDDDKKPTHKKGILDPKYLKWLRDDLKVFDSDGTVKEDYLDRLDPDCLEVLAFNLSAGRHKPFVFDAGQHRPPAELIGELQSIHGDVQKRLSKLLTMVGGTK